MISDVLTSAEGMAIFPVIGLVVFLVVFAAVVLWVVKLDAPSLRRWSSLPLENGTNSDTQGAREHE